LNSIEDFAALKSFKLFSKYNYPLYVFCHNPDNFLNNLIDLDNWRIKVVKIKPLNSLEEYTRFCIESLYFWIKEEKVITLQGDGFLIKSGYEDYLNRKDFDYLSAHWLHNARIQIKQDGQWFDFPVESVNIGNGAFSFRKASKMREISKRFSSYILREYGRNDDRIPQEDLYFTFLGFGYNILKKPQLEQCRDFCLDPIELSEYNNKVCFGFHCPKYINEWKRKAY
jgi:hypothetical protein